MSYRTLGFSEYGMTVTDQCKHFKYSFTPDSNPKTGEKGVIKLSLIYVKEPMLKSLI